MACLYLTVNLHNLERGITPYLYSGSDKNDTPDYYGSNKSLKSDIEKLGEDHFSKIVVETYPSSITNRELRMVESKWQIRDDHAHDEVFYNKTNRAGPAGGVKGMKHRRKVIRSQKWIDSMTGTRWSNESRKARRGSGNPMYGRKAKASTKVIWKEQRTGAKNPNALEWEITTPSGKVVNIKSLKKWCEDNNLSYHRVYAQRDGFKLKKYGEGKGGPGR